MWRLSVLVSLALVGLLPCAFTEEGRARVVAVQSRVTGGTLVRVDAKSGRVRAVVSVGGGPRDVRIASNQIWTSSDGKLVRVDPVTARAHSVGARDVAGFTVAGEDIWAASEGKWLVRFDGATGNRERSLRLSSKRLFAVGDAGFPAAAWGSLWLTVPKLGQPSEPHTLWRLDEKTGQRLATLPIGINPTPPFAAFGSLFTVSAPPIGRNTLLRLRRDAARPIEVATPSSPWGVAAGAGSLWVGGRLDRVLWRLDPRTTRVTATVRLPELPRGLTFARGSLWVTTGTSLLRVDPARSRVVRRIRLAAPKLGDAGLTGIAYLNGSLWVSVI